MPNRSFIPVIVLLASAIALTPQTTSAQAPVLIASWPTANLPLGMAISPSGNVYIGTEWGAPVLARIYTQGGTEIGSIGDISPEIHGVAFLHSGDFLAAEYYSRVVDLYSPGDFPNGTWAIPGIRALYLTVDEQDNVYITDDNGDAVRKVNRSGTLVAEWATPHPAGIAYLGGLVYVAGMWNGTMSIFTPDGTPVGSFPTGCTWAEQLSPDASGNLLLADYGLSQLKCFEPDGTLLWTLGPDVSGYAPGACRFFSVVPGAGGTILTGDFDNRRVLVLGQQPTPANLTTWGKLKADYRY